MTVRVKSLTSHLFLHIGGTQGLTTVAHVSKLFFYFSWSPCIVDKLNTGPTPFIVKYLTIFFYLVLLSEESTSCLFHFTPCVSFRIHPTELCLIDIIVRHSNTAGCSWPSNKRVSPHKYFRFLLSDKQSFKNDRCLITLAHVQKLTVKGCESVAIYSRYPAIRINTSLSLT